VIIYWDIYSARPHTLDSYVIPLGPLRPMHIPFTLHGSSNPAVRPSADVYLGHIILDKDSDGYWRLFFLPIPKSWMAVPVLDQ
jgi:hypothetical protein